MTWKLIPAIASLLLGCAVCLAQSPTRETSAETEQLAESPEYDNGSKLVFSEYSSPLTLKPHDNERFSALGAEFVGVVEIHATLWVENVGLTDSGYYLIPSKASEKLLPRVIGGKHAYPARVDKLLITNEHLFVMGHVPSNIGQTERAALMDSLSQQWQLSFLSELLGVSEANRIFKLKPKVFKVPVVAEITDFFTTVDCDSRGYGARILAIRLAKAHPKSSVAFSDAAKFQGC